MAATPPLQRYQVMEPLGAGGQGNTFRGIDRETSEAVAIKVVSLKKLREWKAFDLFEREVEVLSNLSHPAIPRYIDNYASEETGDYFLVMELVEGTPLSAFIDSEKRFSQERLYKVFEEALDVLEYLHGRVPPVIHRDLKPANMILRRDGSLALVDFGGVRRRGGGASTVVGTFGYMAPEQLHGQADRRSDLYALGATMAALLSGIDAADLPHDGLRIDLPAIGLGDPWFRILEPMLAPEPGERPATAEEVRAAWKRVRREAGSSSSARSGSPPPPGPRSSEPVDSPSSVALATIPESAKALARVPAPVSVLVWILTALGSGALLVFETLLMPLIYQVWSATLRDGKDPTADRRMDADFDEFKIRVRTLRQTLGYVADHTRPGAD